MSNLLLDGQVCFLPSVIFPAGAERERGERKRSHALFQKEDKDMMPSCRVEGDREGPLWKKKINKKIYCKTNQAVLPEPVLSSWRQIFSQILKALAWDRPSFVLCCLWIYFPNTVEFFAFLKTGDPSADTNCFFSSPHWPKSVRIIVFLCKQRIEVNNRSAFTLPGPASPVFSHSFFPFFFWGGGAF